MTALIDTLWCFPVKGMRGHKQRSLFLDTTLGVRDDRQFAIRRRPGDLGVWAPKGVYHVCMNTPKMALERPVFVDGDIDSGKLHERYLQELAGRLGVQGDVQVQYADKAYSLHDTKGAFVSLLNLASVRALSKFVGQQLDPRRFRMNIWMEGLEPFEELTWVNASPGTREIMVGECHLRVDHECKRCRATWANPDTGVHDIDLETALTELMTKRGYLSPRQEKCVMGILAVPLEEGLVRKGDRIELV